MKKKTIIPWVIYTLLVSLLIFLTKGFTFPSGGEKAQEGFSLICWVAISLPFVIKFILSPIANFWAQKSLKKKECK